MRPDRTLALKKDVLAELTSDEMAAMGGAYSPTHNGCTLPINQCLISLNPCHYTEQANCGTGTVIDIKTTATQTAAC